MIAYKRTLSYWATIVWVDNDISLHRVYIYRTEHTLDRYNVCLDKGRDDPIACYKTYSEALDVAKRFFGASEIIHK